MKDPREEIRDIAPLLSSDKIDNGYQMPEDYFEKMQSEVLQKVETENLENYFETLPNKVMDRIASESKNTTTPWTTYISRIAAVAAVVFIAVWTINTTNADTTEQYAVLSEDEIEEMVLLAEDLTLEELVEVGIITDDNIDELMPEIQTEIDLNNYLDEYDEEELVDLL